MLARVYDQKAFSFFGIMSGILAIATPLVSLRYENAILHAKNLSDALKLAKGALCIIAINTILLSVLCLLIAQVVNYMYLSIILCICIVAQAVYNVLQNLCLRLQKYKLINKVSPSISILNIAFAFLFCSFHETKEFGLIYSAFLSILFGMLYLLLIFKNITLFLKHDKYLPTLVKYKEFPKQDLIACSASLLSQYGPLIILPLFCNSKTTGNYFFNMKIFNSISTIIVEPITILFRNSALLEQEKKHNFPKSFKKTFLICLLLGIVGILATIAFGKKVFLLIFSTKWESSFAIFQILVVLFFFKLIASPLSASLFLAKKQRQNVQGQIIILVCTLLSLAIGFVKSSFTHFLIIYTTLLSVSYVFYLIFSFKNANKIIDN